MAIPFLRQVRRGSTRLPRRQPDRHSPRPPVWPVHPRPDADSETDRDTGPDSYGPSSGGMGFRDEDTQPLHVPAQWTTGPRSFPARTARATPFGSAIAAAPGTPRARSRVAVPVLVAGALAAGALLAGLVAGGSAAGPAAVGRQVWSSVTSALRSSPTGTPNTTGGGSPPYSPTGSAPGPAAATRPGTGGAVGPASGPGAAAGAGAGPGAGPRAARGRGGPGHRHMRVWPAAGRKKPPGPGADPLAGGR